MEYEAARMLSALERFISQRSGLEAGNYVGNLDALRADRAEIARDGRDCRIMLAALRRCMNLDAESLREGFKAYGGRLSYSDETRQCEYTPGQYWAIEYRQAAGAVLARAFGYYMTKGAPHGNLPHFRRLVAQHELGRGIARRWFQ